MGRLEHVRHATGLAGLDQKEDLRNQTESHLDGRVSSPSMNAENMPLSSKKAGPASQGTKSGAECAHERVVDYEFSEDGEMLLPLLHTELHQ